MDPKQLIYEKLTPCGDCPYRKAAPLKKWAIEEFDKLLHSEYDTIGATFACHKNDGHVCRGWLMDQVRRGEPSIALRLAFFVNKVPVEYREKLFCKGGIYNSVEEMCLTNYPELDELIQELKLIDKLRRSGKLLPDA